LYEVAPATTTARISIKANTGRSTHTRANHCTAVNPSAVESYV
jgi:hypothetical protein